MSFAFHTKMDVLKRLNNEMVLLFFVELAGNMGKVDYLYVCSFCLRFRPYEGRLLSQGNFNTGINNILLSNQATSFLCTTFCERVSIKHSFILTYIHTNYLPQSPLIVSKIRL